MEMPFHRDAYEGAPLLCSHETVNVVVMLVVVLRTLVELFLQETDSPQIAARVRRH